MLFNKSKKNRNKNKRIKTHVAKGKKTGISTRLEKLVKKIVECLLMIRCRLWVSFMGVAHYILPCYEMNERMICSLDISWKKRTSNPNQELHWNQMGQKELQFIFFLFGAVCVHKTKYILFLEESSHPLIL